MTENNNKAEQYRELKALTGLARRMVNERSYEEAEEKYLQALDIDSSNVFALVGLGDLKRKRRRFEDATDYYERCLEVDENNKYALAGLGDTYRGLRRVDRALELWLRYLSLYPDDYKVMTRVADGFRRKRDLEGSKKYYFMALEINPRDPYALMGLGDIYSREGNEAEALKYFENLIGLSDGISKNSIMALTSAGNIYRRQKQYEKATACYDRVLEIDPKNSYAWHGKADCFRGLMDYSAAVKAWQMALEYGMEPRIAITRIGNAFMSLDDLDQAEESFKEALAHGYDRYAYLGIARIHVKRNHMDKASEIFTLLLDKEPNDSRIMGELKRFAEKHPELERLFQSRRF
jgi:tetratricopeptide (TPR) repeat protein